MPKPSPTSIGQISHDLTHAQLVQALNLARDAILDLDRRGCAVLGVAGVTGGEDGGACVPVITIRADAAAKRLGGILAGALTIRNGQASLHCRMLAHLGCLVKWSEVVHREANHG
jgi:hypothetical protein